MLQVRLLGQFDVRADGKHVTIPSRAGQSLFAFLILNAGTAHRREKLAGLLWPDTSDENARRNLRQELWRIRKALAKIQPASTEYLLAEEISIAFNSNADYWLDVAQLQHPAAADDSSSELISCLALYRGELLPGFYDDWAVLERERLHGVFEQQMQRLMELLIRERRWTVVLEWGERWIALGQTPEPAYRALMIAFGALDDKAKLTVTFERCRAALNKELGVEPADETRTLFEQLIRGDQVASVNLTSTQVANAHSHAFAEPPAPGEPPFKGLQYFDEADADWFFGRELLVAKLIGRLRKQRFFAVIVGASGSGKSSIVRAGMIPALKKGEPLADGTLPPEASQNWHVHVITPTAHPLEALAASLTRNSESVIATATLTDDLARDPRALRLYVRKLAMGDPPHILLVFDQFEELFTLCHDEFERQAFIDNLLAILPSGDGQGGDVTLVIALRADFYAHLAHYAELRDAVAAQQEYVGPMTTEELRRAIEEPARRGGWEFEPGLVDLLLREVGDEPGALPLLSHALLETWKRRSGRTLTLKGYAESGGVRGAIAQTAETVYAQLTSEQQAIARNIFLRLTELGEGTDDTRRRAAFTEFIPRGENAETARAVLNMLTEARLVTLGEDSAEVAHEALIREWSTLREWLTQDREGLRLHRQLTEAAQEWELLERDEGALYRGARLAQTVEWSQANANALNEQERAFLAASVEQERHEEIEREAQRQRELQAAQKLAEEQQRRTELETQRAEEQARAAKRLRRRAYFLASAFVLAIVLAGIALFFGNQARVSAVTAQFNARTAFSRELAAAAVSNLDVDPQRSLLLALQAVSATFSVDKTWTAEAVNALHRAVLAAPVSVTLEGDVGVVLDVAFSPDGKRIATTSTDGTLRVWDAFSGKHLLSLPNRRLATLRPRGSRPNTFIVFSPDGARLTTLDEDDAGTTTVKIWDSSGGKVLQTTTLPFAGQVNNNAIGPDGTRIATSQPDGTVRVWDLTTGQSILTFSGRAGDYIPVAFSPDGRHLAFGGSDNLVHLWDLATRQELHPLNTNVETVSLGLGYYVGISSIAFSSDGTRLAAGLADATARIWDVATGKELITLCCTMNRASMYQASPVAFSPDGTRLATGSSQGNVIIWDAWNGRALFGLVGNTHYSIMSVAFSPDGQRLATVGDSSLAKVWDLSPNGELEKVATGPVVAFAASPDRKRIATSHPDNTVTVWDAATGQSLLTLTGHTALVRSIAFSPDGTQLATASSDTTAKLWDVTTGRTLLTLSGHTRGVNGVAFSPDGTRLATASLDSTVKVWDAMTGQELLTLTGYAGSVNSVAFSPDGTHLATGSDVEVKVWDISTREVVISQSGVHSEPVKDVQYSPDGKRLVTASQDGTARVLDATTGRGFFYLFVQTSPLARAIFNPESTRIATASADGTTRVWDAVTGQELLTLYGHTQGVTGIAFTSDGTRLITSSEDGTVFSFVLPIDDLIGLARSRLTRTWTLNECRQFLHMEQCPELP